MMKLSLCMIVRDEEADLPTCLESVKGVVDEICIVDTGSNDRTVAIAEGYGARVEHFTWCDDFSAARNASLAMAQGDWILVLDADEILENQDARETLTKFAARHPQLGGQVTIPDRQEQGDLRSRVTLDPPRLFQIRQCHFDFLRQGQRQHVAFLEREQLLRVEAGRRGVDPLQ